MRYRDTETRRWVAVSFLVILLALACAGAGCRGSLGGKQSVRPRSLRDVPAQRLAYRFDPDTAEPPGAHAQEEQAEAKLEAIEADFEARRTDDALVRTVVSPDGQRVLALYETGENQPGEFRIDMYGVQGNFLRNLTPPELSGAFAPTVAWSPDGNNIAFIGRKSLTPQPTPTPPDDLALEAPAGSPTPTVSVAPAFAPVPVFNTEQIYVCNRDGFDLRPLTTRDGLIYFYLAWAPDSHALVALACKEDEWSLREREFKLPVGRPRLIGVDGRERLLDDALTEAPPVWSPDSSKVATAFETDVAIYDAATDAPTGARISLREPLLTASVAFEEKNLSKGKKTEGAASKTGGEQQAASSASSPPISFNPIVRLEWPQPEKLFLQTAYVRTFPNDPINNFPRWHTLALSPQATLLSRNERNDEVRTMSDE